MIESIGYMNKPIILAGVTCILACVSAFAWSTNDNEPDSKKPQSCRRVVMMGNSITEFWQYQHGEYFADNGAICRGIAGEETPSMLSRFSRDVVALKPLMVVIAGGINDINNSGKTWESVLENNKAMGQLAVEVGITPIFASITPSGWSKSQVDKYIRYNKEIKKYCEENGYLYCNYFDALTLGTMLGDFEYNGDYNYMKYEYRGPVNGTAHGDNLHPGRGGYLVMESVLIPLLESNIWKDNVYEAEHAVKFGSAQDTADENCSGGTMVGSIGKGGYLKLGYTAPHTATYKFTVDYCTYEARDLVVTVDDKDYTLTCPSTGSWGFDKSGSITFELELTRGFHTMYIAKQDNKWAPNLDKFTIEEMESTAQPITDAYYIYNVGAQKWLAVGESVGSNEPNLTDEGGRSLLTIVPFNDGYRISSNGNPYGWAVDGRNVLSEDNAGQATNKWGTSYMPGWHFVETGNDDGSVYIKYTWPTWGKGSLEITNPSAKSYSLFYGEWTLPTNRWSPTDRNDVTGKTQVYPETYELTLKHGDYSKWIIVPTGDNILNVEKYDVPDWEDDTNSVEENFIENEEEAVYYNLQGIRVTHPAENGLYICRKGSSVKKIIIP